MRGQHSTAENSADPAGKSYQPIAWLVLMNTLWAVGYPVTDIALKAGLDPSLLAALRLVTAFLLLAPELRRVRRWSGRLLGFSAFLGLIGFSIPIWLQIIGLHGTDPAIASISISLEPLVTILGAALATRLGVPWWQQAALTLAVLGSWILTGEPRPGHLSHLGGDAALIASVACFAVYNVYSQHLSRSVEAGPAAALTFGFGALGSVVIWALVGAPVPNHVSWPMIWSTAFMALLATGLAYWLWLHVVSRHSVTVSALFLYVQPLLGTLLSLILGQSPLTLSLILGGLLLLLAMTLGQEARPTWLALWRFKG
ncbi:DMT family transporter [Sulfobacillus harzensis]|uniref:DMT family transporter n=1 Tax=Sulfobacillus harzensis TaxID=2729629 RepID=A0A7Y0L4I9_9FIRM|nr:DMT family transporter [Sulfobacillus harzensis]NMP22541.1 DMT family transporter [Sulfobacillus harzensis]